MRLTTKGRYAVTAMLDLALHHESGPVSLVEIAERQDISLAYLEQLFAKLKRAQLICSHRGPGGGYRLNRSVHEITVSEVIAAVGEGVDATRCHGAADCKDGKICLTHDLWAELSQEIDEFLRSKTLAALMSRHEVSAPERPHLIPAQPL